METLVATLAVQLLMGIVGGQIASTSLGRSDVAPIMKILSGGLGGLVAGLLVGGLVGDENSFFALLGDAGGGLAGGIILTAIVGTVAKRLHGH